MIALPPALADWEEPLSLFPPELALSLGPCVRRLAQALGPLASPADEISDDPNGYDGLSRRGSYERLLISEWLLADEVPEEFLRRAAQREHAFLALSFRRPGGSRRSLALFDAGPELIGEPRIGQLAALVVLSQRARRGGAAFGWGVLQDEERNVSSEVSPSSVLRLLFSRTARTASAQDAAAWAAGEGQPLAADDLWVVGSSRTLQVGGAATSRLELEDPLQPGKRDLAAAVRRKGDAPKLLELPLPARDECVRLLRDPFSARRAPAPARPALPSPVNGIAFSQDGRRLLVRHRDRSVSAHPVPNSPRMPAGHPKTFDLKEGEQLVAAGWTRGARVVLVQDEVGYCLHGLQRADDPPVHWMDGKTRLTAAIAPSPLSTLLHVPGSTVGESSSRHIHVFLDAENQLFKLGGEPDRVVELVMPDVIASTERGGDLHLVRGQKTGPSYLIAHTVNGKDRSIVVGLPGLHAFFGGDSHWIAVEKAPDHWDVFTEVPRPRRYELVVSGSEVFGVTLSPKERTEPSLMIVEPDRCSVGLLGRADYVPLLRTPSPIIQAVASSRGPELALLCGDGTVTVMSLAHRQKVLELRPASAPEPPTVPVITFNLARGAVRERS